MKSIIIKMENFFVIIDPYCLIFKGIDSFLIYNTLNKKKIEINKKSDKNIYELIEKLYLSNIYSLRIKKTYLENEDFNIFIQKIRKYFMGNIILTKSKQVFAFKPLLKIRDNKHTIRIKDDLLYNVTNLVFYVNSFSKSINLKEAYKQFLFPIDNTAFGDFELDFNLAISLFHNYFVNLNSVSLIGGDVFQYKYLDNLINVIKDKTSAKIKIFHLVNRENVEEIEVLSNKYKEISFELFFENDSLLKGITNISKKHTICFVITSEKEYENVLDCIQKYHIENYEIKPYYNGENLEFFKKYIFLNKTNIFSMQQEIPDILAKGEINPIMYGKLFIIGNNFYSNLNYKSIGSIEANLNQLIFNLITKESNWNDTRNRHIPCRNCFYNLICPPISDYEYSFKKYNLCKIK